MKPITKFILILLAASMFFAGAPAMAADPSVKRISADELKAMLDSGETVLIVDVRSSEEFLELHIRGALSVPLHQVEAKLAGLSPDTKIAFY